MTRDTFDLFRCRSRAMVVALVALFFVFGGGACAAVSLVVPAAAVAETPLSGPHVFGWGFNAPDAVFFGSRPRVGRQPKRE